jgi:2-amino-4-hydroxy-6-hydroxymethyldihydropteridine diphosphokinase
LSAGRQRAYVGLGSNLDAPARQLELALTALSELPVTSLVARSRLYRNPPLGPPEQPDYVNAVAALDTALAPLALLAAMQAIERAQGRVRDGRRWGPRTLDLDLIAYADLTIDAPGLKVPHPDLAARPFVLVPLREIAPDAVIPGHAPLADLIARLPAADLAALEVEPAPARVHA